MIQDDDPRRSDVRSASALADHATTLTDSFSKKPDHEYNESYHPHALAWRLCCVADSHERSPYEHNWKGHE